MTLNVEDGAVRTREAESLFLTEKTEANGGLRGTKSAWVITELNMLDKNKAI